MYELDQLDDIHLEFTVVEMFLQDHESLCKTIAEEIWDDVPVVNEYNDTSGYKRVEYALGMYVLGINGNFAVTKEETPKSIIGQGAMPRFLECELAQSFYRECKILKELMIMRIVTLVRDSDYELLGHVLTKDDIKGNGKQLGGITQDQAVCKFLQKVGKTRLKEVSDEEQHYYRIKQRGKATFD